MGFENAERMQGCTVSTRKLPGKMSGGANKPAGMQNLGGGCPN